MDSLFIQKYTDEPKIPTLETCKLDITSQEGWRSLVGPDFANSYRTGVRILKSLGQRWKGLFCVGAFN